MKSLKAGGLEAIGNQIQMILLKQANPSAVPFEDVNFSDRSYNKFTNLSLGAEYKLAPGLLPYAEASFFRMKDSIAPTNNNGAIYLTGLRLTF
jgi:predicted porin